jgi:hypothetical protein
MNRPLRFFTPVLLLACVACAHPQSGSAASAADIPPGAPAPPPQATPSSSTMPRAYGWFSISIGAAASAIALGTSWIMLSQRSTRDADCNAQKVCSSAGLAANAQISSIAGLNAAAWGLTAAGLGVGAFLLLTNPSDDTKQTSIGVVPTEAGGAGLTLRSRF